MPSTRLRPASWSWSWSWFWAALFVGGAASRIVVAETPSADEQQDPGRFAVHGQFTYVEQEASNFRAPYRGPNSLTPDRGRETTDATLYLGARLWPGAEGWIVPEIDQGFGLDDTLGLAGFPSGEAYKVGRNKPYLRLPRLFIRQSHDLGGTTEDVPPDLLQLGSERSSNRLVWTIGKFSVTDIFDTNQYAHDPRDDFLNWTAVDAGTFDYAADAWGYTVGIALEWYQGPWTLRGGAFDLSTVPNSVHLDPGFHEFQLLAELERRHELWGRSGRLLLTAFDSRGRMGALDAAVRLAQQTGQTVDVSAVRQYRGRIGVDVNLEQDIATDLGMFARAGWAAGNVEVYEFTDVDRTVTAGLALKGSRWGRAQDKVGVAGIVNGISTQRQRFLNAGGLGILVGDGKLPHPGSEQILETYYELAILGAVRLTMDYQWVRNPAYNEDRGPISIFTVRVHAQI
ncbi:MAG TPA: carbohydrate porin [Steroidobacteraceae bacterium]